MTALWLNCDTSCNCTYARGCAIVQYLSAVLDVQHWYAPSEAHHKHCASGISSVMFRMWAAQWWEKTRGWWLSEMDTGSVYSEYARLVLLLLRWLQHQQSEAYAVALIPITAATAVTITAMMPPLFKCVHTLIGQSRRFISWFALNQKAKSNTRVRARA